MHIKGITLFSLLEIAKSFGEEAYESWLNSLPEEAQNIYRWQILSSSWYDTEIFYTPAVESLTIKHFGGDYAKIGQIIGKAAAQLALTGAYRLIVEKKDPVAFFERGTMLMRQVLRPSRSEVNVFEDKREALLELCELPKPYAVYEAASLNYVIEALKMVGYPVVKWEITSYKSKGAECTKYHFSW